MFSNYTGQNCHEHTFFISCSVGWWCSTSHSAIFQLYSDGILVQFPNLGLLPGTKGSFTCQVTLTFEGVFNLLAVGGLVHSEGTQRIQPGPPDPQSTATSMPPERAINGACSIAWVQVFITSVCTDRNRQRSSYIPCLSVSK